MEHTVEKINNFFGEKTYCECIVVLWWYCVRALTPALVIVIYASTVEYEVLVQKEKQNKNTLK